MRYRGNDEGELRNEAEHQHDDAAGDADPAAVNAGDADQPDILRVGHVGEGVEDGADDGAERIRAQAALDVVGVDLAAGHGAKREKHAGRFDEHDCHHQAHGQARDQIELRHAELQRQDRAHDRLLGNAGKIRPAETDGDQIADRDPDQDRDVLQKAAGELDHQEDHGEHEPGDQQIAGRAEIRLAGAAAGPIDADPHQHHADHGDDRAGHYRREKAQHVFDERRDAEAKNAADQNGAVDSGQSDAGHCRHRQHRRDRHRGDPHDDRQPDAEGAEADGLDQRRYSAGEQIGIDQHRQLVFRQMQRAADDQGHRHRIGIHDEHMLQSERAELR